MKTVVKKHPYDWDEHNRANGAALAEQIAAAREAGRRAGLQAAARLAAEHAKEYAATVKVRQASGDNDGAVYSRGMDAAAVRLFYALATLADFGPTATGEPS